MEYGRTSHAVYELQYHLVWVPKFRRAILKEPAASALKRIFKGTAERYGFEIVEQEVMPDHVHLFVSASPRWSVAELVNVLKSVSWVRFMREYPEMKEITWGGPLWSSGYFVRATGDKVTSSVIQRYIRHQRRNEDEPKQQSFKF